MSVTATPTITTPRRDRDYLWWAVAISAVLHGSAAWWLMPSSTKSVVPSSVEVALLNFSTESAPLRAQLLAQWQADGGGTEEHVTASAPHASATLPSPDELVLMAMEQRRWQLEEQQHQLLSQLESTWSAHTHTPDYDPLPNDALADDAAAQTTPSAAPSTLHALRAAVELYNQAPRYIFEGPAAHQSAVAEYIEAWRARIEALGTELYPEQARGRQSGTVQLTVYIRQDGSLERMVIHQPADDPLFTLTAQRVVNLAAPFAPFSAELAQLGDVLAITRTWHFHQHQLRTQTP